MLELSVSWFARLWLLGRDLTPQRRGDEPPMSAGLCLARPVECGDHVRSQVNGELTWQFDLEPRTLTEKPLQSLDRCGHGDREWLRGRESNPLG